MSNYKTITVVLTLLIAATIAYGESNTVEVTGFGECADCNQNNIKHSHALKGLKVTIDCKLPNKEVIKTRGSGELDEQGKFLVNIPTELIQDGKLKEECYAQLHSASNTPCPSYNGIQSSKLTNFSKTSDGKHTFTSLGKLKFSSVTCTSAFLWPYYKYPPYFPKKSFPKIYKKPYIPIYKKPFYKKPIYYKPFPPTVPVYEKPLYPPVTIIKKKPCLIFKKKAWPTYPPHH